MKTKEMAAQKAGIVPVNSQMYQWRYWVENFFCELKEFKRMVIRNDKSDLSPGYI
jgi:hypothetical protein